MGWKTPDVNRCLHLALVMAVLAVVVQAMPQQIRLSLTQQPDEMVVTWVTPYWAGTSIVQYGLKPTELKNRKWTQDNENYGFNSGYGRNNFARSIRLRNLKPSTKYFYRVGNDKQGWSQVFNFFTQPEPGKGEITFLAVADQDVNAESKKVINQMVKDRWKYQYNYAVVAGDIAYGDGDQGKWNNYANIMQPFASITPTMYAVGERDIENGGLDAFNNRYRWGVTGNSVQWGWGWHWYEWKAGAVQSIVLSSEHDTPEEANWQENFLEDVLKKANVKENRMLRPWIVVFLHRPAYNSPPYKDRNEDVQRGLSSRLQDKFHPLYVKYKVNVVVCGHCHNYERTFPMKGNQIVDTRRGWEKDPYIAPVFSTGEYKQGTVHLTVGTGGRPVEDVGERPGVRERPCIVKQTWGNVFMPWGRSQIEREHDCGNGCFSTENTAYINTDSGFGVFDASRRQLHFQFVSADYPGSIIDEMIMCSMPGCDWPPPLDQKTKQKANIPKNPNPKDREELDESEEPPPDIPEPGTNELPVYVPSQQRYAPMPVGMDIKEFLKRYPAPELEESEETNRASNIAESVPAQMSPQPVPGGNMNDGDEKSAPGQMPSPGVEATDTDGSDDSEGGVSSKILVIAAVCVGCGVLLLIAITLVALHVMGKPVRQPDMTVGEAPAAGDVAVELGTVQQMHNKKKSISSFPVIWLTPR
mmetsp:Transcript_5405/g.15044  ORF Transcript_5405/g.15044 Transcript_5405/m.15044 type:complete len:697 (-) Transcript_5405:293-2383(-)